MIELPETGRAGRRIIEARKIVGRGGGFLGMRKIYSLAAIIILCVLLLSYEAAYAWSGMVVAVKDVDTIEVLHDGRAETIRLYA